MKITVHEDLCTGHGRCYSIAPNVFSSDDEGFCAQRGTTFEVQPELTDDAQFGADSCPEGAIDVIDA